MNTTQEGNEEKDLMQISGIIVKRRCLGKHLSFATLLNTTCDKAHDDAYDDEPIQVAFRRAHFDHSKSVAPSTLSDNQHHDHHDGLALGFPVKASDLPYGAHVTLRVIRGTNAQQDARFQVRSWSLMGPHPRTQALQAAATRDGAVSCTLYFKARCDMFQSLQSQQRQQDNNSTTTNNHPRATRETVRQLAQRESGQASKDTADGKNSSANRHNPISIEKTEESRPDYHGSGSGRAKVFAEWLVENLPLLQKQMDGTSPVTLLDVAGGKGQLSVELAKFSVACTVMDPLVRSKRSRRKLDKSRQHLPAVNIPSFVAARFEQDRTTDEIVRDYDCVVGFHPDECTESIVDVALKHRKAFAVVPCCVFPSLFPMRQLGDGKRVQSYEEFLEFLLEKDTRLKRATLPIEGKNQVIYLSSADA